MTQVLKKNGDDCKCALACRDALARINFAAVGQTPFIALSYDPKIDAFANQANQPVFAHVEDDHWDGEALFSYIQQCMNKREERKEAMIYAVAPLQQTAQQTAAEALALFRK